MTSEQHADTSHEDFGLAKVIVLFTLTLGSLPVFAVIAGPVESLPLSVLVGFGGWSVWCSIVTYATRGWLNDDAE